VVETWGHNVWPWSYLLLIRRAGRYQVVLPAGWSRQDATEQAMPTLTVLPAPPSPCLLALHHSRLFPPRPRCHCNILNCPPVKHLSQLCAFAIACIPTEIASRCRVHAHGGRGGLREDSCSCSCSCSSSSVASFWRRLHSGLLHSFDAASQRHSLACSRWLYRT
jgi:hypothetical protein